MPSRFRIRDSVTDAIYHIINRGSDRRAIFRDGRDYRRFLNLLRDSLAKESAVTLLTYCLMPNHFHLLVLQAEDTQAVSRFMRRVTIGYVMYFNAKYRRVGPLFQGRFATDRVVGPVHLMDVSRYIHLNPLRAGLGWQQYQYSSISAFIHPFPTDPLVKAAPVLKLFDLPSDYEQFLYREMRSPGKTSNNS